MTAYVGPSRGGWQFRCVPRSGDAFDFYPTLESIEITDARPEDAATFSCEVVDENNTLVFQVEDKVWVKFDGIRVFAGHIKRRGRGQESEVGPRTFLLEAQDYTAKLDDSVITRKKDRKRETIRKRLRWVYKHLNFGMDLDLSGVPTDEYVEPANYHGQTCLEAFESIASDRSLFMDVDFDDDEDGSPTLSFFRTITAVAQFDLDNSAPDFSDTYPYREFVDFDDSQDLATMVYVIPEKEAEAKWSYDATQKALYGWQQSSLTDTSLKGPKGARRIGGKFLSEFDQPLTDGNCVVHEPGLRTGAKVHIVNALWGLDYDRYITSVVTTAVDPHDDAGDAYLRSYIEFSDRRKVHRRPSRPIRGDIAVPTDPEPTLDDWPTIAPPTQSDGDPITLVLAGTMTHSRDHWDVSNYQDPYWTSLLGKTGSQWLRSHLNGYQSWVGKVSWSTCGGLNNHFGGFSENEVWMRCLMPAIPSGAAGIEFDMPISNSLGGVQGPGYAEVGAVEIVASAAQPTTMREGTAVGLGYRNSTVTVTVPADLLPAEGDYLYVGYRTSWHASTVSNPYAHACGFNWPFMSNSYQKDQGGIEYLGQSGRIRVGATSITGVWKVWDGTEPVLGTTPQGHTINDAGYSGEADAWSMGPDGISVIADSPSSKGIYLVGANEDVDEPFAPWSDGTYAAKVYFTVTADGSTSDAGLRNVQLTATSDAEESIGTVHLGDGTHAEGVSVAGPSGESFQALDLTNGERMVAMFDTRNGDTIRGKIWLESEGEPTEWVVFSDLTETEDINERLTLWLRAGNDGTEQGVTVHKVETFDGAAAGQRVTGHFIGHASGYEKSFYTPDKYKAGTLKVFVNGKLTPTQSEDGDAASFQLDWWPTEGSAIVVEYTAAGGTETDD